MYDGDELHSEPGLHVMGDMFDDGGNGVASSERRVHDYSKVFDLKIGFVQDFKWVAIVKVMVEGND